MSELHTATLLILCSALLHAVWNAVLKTSISRAAMIGLLNVYGALIALPLLAIVPLPNSTEWLWILVSVVLHLAYQLSLARMMATADYSLVYPFSRGIGPMVVTILAVTFLDEKVTKPELMAIGVLVIGILLSSLGGIRGKLSLPPINAIMWAGLVGTLIGLYTLVDGSTVKLMNPYQFLIWSNIVIMPPMLAILIRQNGLVLFSQMRLEWRRALVMTFIALSGYMLALLALHLGKLSEIAALRETSIFFAAFIGLYWLKESLTLIRLIGVILIACGALLIQLF